MFTEFKSRYDFNETLNRIKSFLNKNNIKIFSEIDHKKNAESVGMNLNNEYLIIFGSPVLGTNLMLDDPRSGIELPMRMLIYENNGINVLYLDPKDMKSMFKLRDDYLNKMSDLIKKIRSELEY